eukprot:scaffold10365_cov102-Skeletonema_dohrnii-CCMP3373.AAC.3
MNGTPSRDSGGSRNNELRPRRVNPSSRGRRQRELGSIRSSLQTIESMGTHLSSSGGEASYDVFKEDDDDDDNDDDGSDGGIHNALNNLNNSFNNSLMVSFPSMNEQELTHLRKWNRRLQRTEVFDRYYFPEKWEQMEMNDLIDFLNVEDPLAKGKAGAGDGLRNSGHKRSGNKRRSSNVGSFQDPPAERGGLGRIASSLTSSFNASSDKITKLVNPKAAETKQQILDPAKATKQALESIFFPYVHDPKSVLLKRGSVFLYNRSLSSERELMLFSNGFLLADLVLDDVFRMFFSLSDREFVTEKSFLDYLRSKFRDMDEGRSGEIARWQVRQLFSSLGLPMCENIIVALFERRNKSKNENDDKDHARWETVHKAVQSSFAEHSSSNNFSSSSLDDSGSDRHTNSDTNIGLKKFFGSLQREKVKSTTVESASVFSSVVRVDSLNICHGEDTKSVDVANSAEALVSFSVTLKERENDPLVFICSRPEYRDAWVDAFVPVVIPKLRKSNDPDAVEMKKKLGWEYLVIRSSFITHIIANNVELLECCLQEIFVQDRTVMINSLDEFNGYSPLHYATILSHTECMDVLLENGANFTIEDRDGKSAMYHALRERNDKVADVLEKYGADRNDDLRRVIIDEIQEQEDEASKSAANNDDQLSDDGVDMSCSDRSRDSVTEALMDAARRFG